MNMVTSDEYYDFLDRIGIPWQQRRNIYRGKNLGSSFTSEQKARIADGTFKGLFIGDYWSINENYWRIADINYYVSTGDIGCYKNHIMIVPDFVLDTAVMNDTNTTAGCYVGSKYNNQLYTVAKSKIDAAFPGAVLLYHRVYLPNAMSGGRPVSGEWNYVEMLFMNEPMIMGSYVMTPGSNGDTYSDRMTVEKTQMALFNHNPSAIVGYTPKGRANYWLRDIASSAAFALVSSEGLIYNASASTAKGVRPSFGLTGE